jgi:hypothetical protein
LFSLDDLPVSLAIRCATALLLVASETAVTASEPTRLHRWTSLNWDHTDFPLFSLYGPIDHKPDAATIEKILQETRNVLDIHRFREVVLADDEKGISMTLDDHDGRVLKKLVTKSERGWFVGVAPPKEFAAGPSSVALIAVAPSMREGRVVFSQREAGSIAQNLRYRFRIAEFRLVR